MTIIHEGPFILRLVRELDRTDRSSGCWEWQGTIARTGYGQMRLRNEATLLAHRLSYELHYGPIADGMCVLHRCDNRRCVNPDHLFLGTKGDNNTDRHTKGRSNYARGEQRSKKLTDADVRMIRELRDLGVPLKEIARRYGIVESHVSQIHRRKIWAHVK